jgi:hypothetical protein
MESRSGDALKDEELDVPTEGWKIGVPIGYPCDVIVPKMLMDRPDNMEPFHRLADNNLALGPEAIT